MWGLGATLVAAGDDARQMLDAMRERYPMMADIDGTPNAHLVIFDLTTAGAVSQHKGPSRYRLAVEGVEASLPSLAAKPIHVTAQLDGHFERGKKPKAIGTMIGGVALENADQTVTIRAVASLWSDDFPGEVDDIVAKREIMGASYEIMYPVSAAKRVDGNVVEISSWVFSGAAILKKASAAHPESQLLVASVMDEDDLERLVAEPLDTEERNDLLDSDFALIQERNGRKVRRFPLNDEAHRRVWARVDQAKDMTDAERAATRDSIMNRAKLAGDAWAKPYYKANGTWVKTAGGRAQMKFPGIPEELHASVDSIVAAALKASSDVQKMADLEKQIAAMKSELTASQALIDTERKAATKSLETAQAEAKTAKDGFEAQIAELTGKVTAMDKKMKDDESASKAKAQEAEAKIADLEAKLAEAEAKIAAIEAEKAAAELAAKASAELDKLAAEHGFDAKDKKVQGEKLPIITKMLSGQAVSIDEAKSLTAGGKVVVPAPKKPVPLFAGNGDGEPDPAKVIGQFSVLRRLTATK
jgi:hypothetical protein